MANQVEVIVGTYEEYLLGYKVQYAKNEELSLSLSFATKSHSACVKCLAVSGKLLASGGADDRIFIYDMLTRRVIQILIHHEGNVNTVEFTPEATHILSGGDDGKIVAIRANTWQTQAEWKKAHDGAAVTNIKCHPTGKLAISLGNDITLRSWNLIKGRLLYTTNLKSTLGRIADGVSWSKSGRFFTLTGDRVVQIWKIENASKVKEQSCDSRPTTVCWLTDEELVVGLENGKLMLLTTDVNKEPIYFDAHKQRVKAIAYVNEILATASSSGDIALWNLDIENYSLKQICLHNIGYRPTCIALIDLTQFDDDYILKREEKETANQTEKLSNKSNNRSLESMESVTVEYDEYDVPLLVRAKKEHLERKAENISKRVSKKKDNIVGRRSNKDVNQWIESPISQIPLVVKDEKIQWTETPIKGKLIKHTSKVKLKRKQIFNDSITSPKVKFRKKSVSPDAKIKTTENFEQLNFTKDITDDFKGFDNSNEKYNKNSPNKVNVLSKKDEKYMSKERREKFVKCKENEEKFDYNLEKLLVENEKRIQLIEENSNKKKKEKQKNNIEGQDDEKLKNVINRDNTEEEIKQNKKSKKATENEKEQKLTPSKETRSKILFSPSKQTRSQTAKLLTGIDLRVKELKQENADNEVMEKKTLKKRGKKNI